MNYSEIKSTITLLHRIAVNLDVLLMLMQAQLFRQFQQVFNALHDNQYKKRLGVIVVVTVKLQPTNLKIDDEL